MQGNYLFELSNTLICDLNFNLSTAMKINKVENLMANQSHSMRSQNKMMILFLISGEWTTEVDEIDNCIDNKCIEYRLSNAMLISFNQVETKSNISNEGVLDYHLGKEKIKHSLTDDLRSFLENLFMGNIKTDLNEERYLFLINKPNQNFTSLMHQKDQPDGTILNRDIIWQKSSKTIEMKIGYKQQKSILYREDSAIYEDFEWWFPPVDRQQVYEDESAKFTTYHVLRRSRGFKRILKRRYRYDSIHFFHYNC